MNNTNNNKPFIGLYNSMEELYMCVYIYIYIYIERERERERAGVELSIHLRHMLTLKSYFTRINQF